MSNDASMPSARVPDTPDELFRAIANFTYDWETWSDRDGRPRWINPAVERISGYSPAECFAMPDYPLPIVHPDDRAMIGECLSTAAAGGSGNDVEFRVCHKNGSERWGAVSWQTISDENGASIGYRTSVRDITLRKETESALRQAQKASEAANADKSRFLAAASHDLRQPIQAASMFVTALSNARDDDERDHIVSAIRDSLDATHDLLGALLDVSRLDAGVLEPEQRTFAAADLLEQLEIEFEALSQDKDLDLAVIPSSQTVQTDPVMLLRILRNFVSNAIRYTEQGRVLVGARRRGAMLRLEVWDTGIGIDPSHIDEIFDDFRQLNNPERDRTRGLGLGLAIVRRKARLLGLKIDVRSELGRGSVFSVSAPLSGHVSPAETPAPSDLSAVDLTGTCVVYIDDDSTQLEAMATVLRQWGATPICADSAIDAIARLNNGAGRPDAIIADYRLRDNQDGASAIRAVSRAVRRKLPAMILTGDTEPTRIAEATASGFALLHKPVSPSVLKHTLHDILAKH